MAAVNHINPMLIQHAIDTFIAAIVQRVSDKIALTPTPKPVAMQQPVKAEPKRRHAVNMQCRVPRCHQRSRGPRFRYMCEKHGEELSVREQREILRKQKAKL